MVAKSGTYTLLVVLYITYILLIQTSNGYRQTKVYIENKLTTPKFLLVLHGGDGGSGADVNCLKLARKFYKLLKHR